MALRLQGVKDEEEAREKIIQQILFERKLKLKEGEELRGTRGKAQKNLLKEVINSRTSSIKALTKLIEDPVEFNKFFTKSKDIDAAGQLDKILSDEETQIGAKITAAAPKIFNININNLVETFNVNSTTLKEGAINVRQQIEQALVEALADVQTVAG